MMKTGISIVAAVVCMLAISAESARHTKDIDKAEWLIGTWENKTSRGNIYESWVRVSENEFSGKSYIIKEQDMIVFETIQLLQKQDTLLYIPTVKNQNDGMPVRFTAISISNTQLIFENPEHDFPQFISYTKISEDSLVAEISGVRNGHERRQTFPMRRVN